MKKSLLLIAITTTFLAGCTTVTEKIAKISPFKSSMTQNVALKTSFNPDDAAYILTDGTATISGSSAVIDASGEKITCAGNNVYLVPVNDYSHERYQYLFGNATKGFSPDSVIQKVRFTPDNPEFRKYMRVSTCTYTGEFSFENVPEGQYYIGTNIISELDGYNTIEGGAYAKEITIKPGQSLKIELN